MCWGRWGVGVADGLRTVRDRMQVDVSDVQDCDWDSLGMLGVGRMGGVVSMNAAAAVAAVAAAVAVGSVGWAEVWTHFLWPGLQHHSVCQLMVPHRRKCLCLTWRKMRQNRRRKRMKR